ncbi:MAG: flagellar biosynthesis protein FlhF [Nitrospirae bacterium]|nr:MAG: flagellar biosynthesis protein FlhF [Nitrospirota bacterium]
MKIKTFQALTMSDAIRSIKEELGPDAVILSSKQIRKGSGVFGIFGRPMVEVAAAVDAKALPLRNRSGGSSKRVPDVSSRERQQSAAVPRQGVQGGAVRRIVPWEPPREEAPRRQASTRQAQPPRQADPVRHWDEPDRDTRFEAALSSQMQEECEPDMPFPDHQAQSQGRSQAAPPGRAAAQGSGGRAEWARIQEEVQGLRRLVESSLQGRPRLETEPALSPPSGQLAAWQQHFLRAGLEPEQASRLVAEAQRRLQPTDLRSESAIRQALHRVLTQEVKVSGPLLGLGDWKKTVIFTGPTGVGKTTTIAKLAAQYRLKEKRSVALITLDTYRVAAVEHLRMYANVLGVTMDVALTKQEALDCIRKRSKAELILIDTAGRSPRDEAGIEELRRLIALDHPLETHLVLSATTRERDLKDGAIRYAGLPIDRLLFTKLDETSGFGGIFDLMGRTGLPLSYLSTGQRVPEDLDVARPERVADLLLDGELKPAASGVKREA